MPGQTRRSNHLLPYAVVLITSILMSSAHADIYRCPTPDGGTRYSDTPCPDGERLDLSPQPSGGAEAQGLREAERDMLERLQRRDTPPESAGISVAPTHHAACPGIRILSIDPFTRTTTEIEEIRGLLYRIRTVQQCAGIRLETTAYYGRLRASVAELLTTRLRAQFADGSWQTGQQGELTDAPRRFGVRETVGGHFCFGPNETSMVHIACD